VTVIVECAGKSTTWDKSDELVEGFRSKPNVLEYWSFVYNPAAGVNLKPLSASDAVTSVLLAKATLGADSSTRVPPMIALTSYATGTKDPSAGSEASFIAPDIVCTRSVVDALKLDESGTFTKLDNWTSKVLAIVVATLPERSVTLISNLYVASASDEIFVSVTVVFLSVGVPLYV
jgi:hypothetical protein